MVKTVLALACLTCVDHSYGVAAATDPFKGGRHLHTTSLHANSGYDLKGGPNAKEFMSLESLALLLLASAPAAAYVPGVGLPVRGLNVAGSCSLASGRVSAVMASGDPVEDILVLARSGPLFVTSAGICNKLEELAKLAVESRSAPAWPRDSELLCRPWRLLATTNAAARGRLPSEKEAEPWKPGFRVLQNWNLAPGEELRCDNIIGILRPRNPGLLSLWKLLPPGGVSVKLQHQAKVLLEETPLRTTISLDSITLAKNRHDGSAEEEMGKLSSVPQVQGPSSGTPEFDTLYLDENLRITRGIEKQQTVLRFFEPDDE